MPVPAPTHRRVQAGPGRGPRRARHGRDGSGGAARRAGAPAGASQACCAADRGKQ